MPTTFAEMTHLQIAALYIALNVIVSLALAINAGRTRGKTKILLGDGGNEALTRAMRAHANNIEYTPLGLVMLLALAGLQASIYLLHGVGLALLLGRMAHGYGLSTSGGITPGRMFGMILTMGAFVAGLVGLFLAAF